MNYTDQTLNILDRIRSNLRVSSKMIHEIPNSDIDLMAKSYPEFANERKKLLCCVAYGRSPACECCGISVEFVGNSTKFRKFCSLKCANSINNKLNNSTKNKNRALKLKSSYEDKLNVSKDLFLNSSSSIKNIAESVDIPLYTLRSFIKNLDLHRPDIKSINHNIKYMSENPFLFDGTIQSYINSGHTSKTISEIFNVSPNTIAVYGRKLGVEWKNKSSYETSIQHILESLNVNYVKNDRKILNGLELDFYIPEKNVAIEINGEYWHSDLFKDKNYHLNKTELCEKNGIRLLQFYTNEFDKFECVMDIIKSALGIFDTILYARKCVLKKIDNGTAKQFLEKNHLFGHARCSHSYGLYYNDELVSVATFGPCRFNKKYRTELIRFANKIGTTVVGGLGKIVSNVKSKFDSIISYAHRRIFTGNVYLKCGFTKSHITPPSYFWYSKQHGIINRYKTQKHKLDTVLTENQYMRSIGFLKVYDCGQIVYTLG